MGQWSIADMRAWDDVSKNLIVPFVVEMWPQIAMWLIPIIEPNLTKDLKVDLVELIREMIAAEMPDEQIRCAYMAMSADCPASFGEKQEMAYRLVADGRDRVARYLFSGNKYVYRYATDMWQAISGEVSIDDIHNKYYAAELILREGTFDLYITNKVSILKHIWNDTLSETLQVAIDWTSHNIDLRIVMDLIDNLQNISIGDILKVIPGNTKLPEDFKSITRTEYDQLSNLRQKEIKDMLIEKLGKNYIHFSSSWRSARATYPRLIESISCSTFANIVALLDDRTLECALKVIEWHLSWSYIEIPNIATYELLRHYIDESKLFPSVALNSPDPVFYHVKVDSLSSEAITDLDRIDRSYLFTEYPEELSTSRKAVINDVLSRRDHELL